MHKCLQCNISRLMSESIITKLKIININDRNARLHRHIFYTILKVTSVICTCQDITIQLIIIPYHLADQFLASVRIQKAVIVKFLHKFHHLRHTVDLYIPRNHLIDILIHEFPLGLLCLLAECHFRCTVLAHLLISPERIAFA